MLLSGEHCSGRDFKSDIRSLISSYIGKVSSSSLAFYHHSFAPQTLPMCIILILMRSGTLVDPVYDLPSLVL